MKEFEIVFVRFKKKKGVFSTAQVSRIVRGVYYENVQPATDSRPTRGKKESKGCGLRYKD